MKVSILTVSLCSLLLLGAACAPQGKGTPAPAPVQVQIDAPNAGAVLPLAPVTIQFEGTSLGSVSEFELSINGTLEANVPPSETGSCGSGCGTRFYGGYSWNPPEPGVFTISLRAYGNGEYSPVVEIEITITEQENFAIQPSSGTPTALPDVPSQVMIAGLREVNCREGGGIPYPIMDTLLEGQPVEAIARSLDGLYLQIIGPKSMLKCWVWRDFVEFEQGDIEQLPVAYFPQLSVETVQEPTEPEPTATRKPFGVP